MDKETRTKNSIRNMKVNFICQIAVLLANFIVRTVFIQTLSQDYFGINGLFTNILSLLSLAEMGIGNAIVFSMYLPLATKDILRVKAMMNFYKKVYERIGLLIGCVGLLCIPFLNFFMKEQPQIDHFLLIYSLYLLNTVLSYFYAYKRAIIIADQKMYLVSLIQNGIYIGQYLVQAVCLFVTHNFILYLVIQILASILVNIAITEKANKLYPFLKKKGKERLEPYDRKTIGENIRALFLHRFGDVVINNTDNILISKLVGISSVGLYSNYVLISNAVSMVINQVFDAFTASVGNLNSVKEGTDVYEIYNPLLFFCFWICGFSMIGMYYLFNPFIEWWVGTDYLLSTSTVLLVCFNFYLLQMRRVNLIFKEALGIFRQDRFRAVLEALLNLGISIVLGKQFGITGVLAGTTISMILTTFWLEPFVLFRFGFERSVGSYFARFLFYSVVVLVNWKLTGFLVKLVLLKGIWGLIMKMGICMLVPNLLFCLFFFKKKEFRVIVRMVRRHIKIK